MAAWHIEGQYMETCNCTFICPCIGTNMEAVPTEGQCKAAFAMRIDKGNMGDVTLDGVTFIVILQSPGAMAEGDMKVGLIIDDKASDEQVEAIGQIASGAVGGPMAVMAPLVGEFAGIERAPISFEMDGMNRAVKAGDMIDQAITGITSMADESQPIYLDNTGHPANSKLALAKAAHSHYDVFGIKWDASADGERNGHFAPFSWAA
jgi:hypothetical protein